MGELQTDLFLLIALIAGTIAVRFLFTAHRSEHPAWSMGFLFRVVIPGVLAFGSGVVAVGSIVVLAWDLSWIERGEAVRECLCFGLAILAANQFGGWAKALKLPGARVPVNVENLGPKKTWGAYYGILGATLTLCLQGFIPALQSGIVNYENPYLPALGVAFGLFAIWGDHGESLVKRGRDIAPGEPWWPFDQLDFLVPSGAFALFIFRWDALPRLLGFAILTLVFIHPIGNYAGYRMKLRTRVL